jgi:hypothetical protein
MAVIEIDVVHPVCTGGDTRSMQVVTKLRGHEASRRMAWDAYDRSWYCSWVGNGQVGGAGLLICGVRKPVDSAFVLRHHGPMPA